MESQRQKCHQAAESQKGKELMLFKHKEPVVNGELKLQHTDKVIRLHATIAWFFYRDTGLRLTTSYILSRRVAGQARQAIVANWVKDAKSIVKYKKGKLIKLLATGLSDLDKQWPKLKKVSKEDRVGVWEQFFDRNPHYTCWSVSDPWRHIVDFAGVFANPARYESFVKYFRSFFVT